MLRDIDSMDFVTFLLLLAKHLQLKNLVVLGTGLDENLTHVVFRHPLVIEPMRTNH